MADSARSMTRREYQALRHRYRQARRDDSRHTTMNASEWRRGIAADAAGSIRAGVPSDIAATLDRPAPQPFPVSPRLRAALARHHGRKARTANARIRQQAIAAAFAQSRALNRPAA